jgi:7-keto-8-aminopelargonate synthetase-like enzyme
VHRRNCAIARRTKIFRAALTERGLTISLGTPDCPIAIGDAANAVRFAAACWKGVYVIGFFSRLCRTAPRVRTQVSVAHSRRDLNLPQPPKRTKN